MQDSSVLLCEHCPAPWGYFPGILCVPTSTHRTDSSVCAYLYQAIICIWSCGWIKALSTCSSLWPLWGFFTLLFGETSSANCDWRNKIFNCDFSALAVVTPVCCKPSCLPLPKAHNQPIVGQKVMCHSCVSHAHLVSLYKILPVQFCWQNKYMLFGILFLKKNYSTDFHSYNTDRLTIVQIKRGGNDAAEPFFSFLLFQHCSQQFGRRFKHDIIYQILHSFLWSHKSFV